MHMKLDGLLEGVEDGNLPTEEAEAAIMANLDLKDDELEGAVMMIADLISRVYISVTTHPGVPLLADLDESEDLALRELINKVIVRELTARIG